jgi:hypothetical protein
MRIDCKSNVGLFLDSSCKIQPKTIRSNTARRSSQLIPIEKVALGYRKKQRQMPFSNAVHNGQHIKIKDVS